MCACVRVCMCACVHVCVFACVHVHVHVHVYTCMPTRELNVTSAYLWTCCSRSKVGLGAAGLSPVAFGGPLLAALCAVSCGPMRALGLLLNIATFFKTVMRTKGSSPETLNDIDLVDFACLRSIRMYQL